ncbi:uncharacterized protein SCHCODRAFT_02507519 [Schizophyllum commune H4-8]|uniref:uncharacterized protein n=1 Tax=Schizophyllum commune (strain H4-8 / FGSC 9210) TaxID=578458 RepID=UPI00215F1776|nr:uncharacterized protein SCHCODRAFT_02507519 [Schizophyllum commune H4-8]KAI5890499.1 hypothetical protein SCHCODRAFT_02507519 [Schizophyllum commune H4-8]
MYTAPNPPPPPAVSSAAKGVVNVGAYESVFSKDDDFTSTPTLTSATFDYDGNTPEPGDMQEQGVQILAARTISQRPSDAQRRGSDSQAQGNVSPPGNNHWGAQSGSYDVDMESPQSSAPADPPKLMRIVTLLIEDMRYENADSQLAEVRVPLKIDHDGGFWADAKDICDQLQGSPSRIDGPAKVFTMRGKYRQIFLRVSDDNVDTSTSMNVAVSLERTIEVFIEPVRALSQLFKPVNS